jgi:predicted Zn-dependent peptidase
MEPIRTITLDCGVTLVVERIPGVSSASLNWLLPLGSATDSAELDGTAAMLSELIFRGCGEMTSREHSDALDRVGVQRSSNVGTHHLSVQASLVGARLPEALPLITMMIRRPTMSDDAVDAVRSLSLQSLDSLDDDPQHLVMLRLHERNMPVPFNRHGLGRREVLEALSAAELRESWLTRCLPGGSILGVAGDVNPEALQTELNALLSDWSGVAADPVELAPPQRGRHHVTQSTAQVHMAIGYDAPRDPDPRSMLERVAISVLSGGTSARLFHEVRGKRALVYSVSASYRPGRDYGRVSMYAGTTPERAEQTLQVCCDEVQRLRKGVDADEFDRAIVGFKSHLVMQGESTPARAAAISMDHFRRGRARTLHEIAAEVDAVSLKALNEYLRDREIGEFTVVTIGPQ